MSKANLKVQVGEPKSNHHEIKAITKHQDRTSQTYICTSRQQRQNHTKPQQLTSPPHPLPRENQQKVERENKRLVDLGLSVGSKSARLEFELQHWCFAHYALVFEQQRGRFAHLRRRQLPPPVQLSSFCLADRPPNRLDPVNVTNKIVRKFLLEIPYPVLQTLVTGTLDDNVFSASAPDSNLPFPCIYVSKLTCNGGRLTCRQVGMRDDN